MSQPVWALRNDVRDAFQSVTAQQAPHTGLLLDRGLIEQGVEGERGKDGLLRRARELPVGPLYAAAYERWRAYLGRQPHVQLAEMAVQDRLIVGLGNESVLEAAITLQHTYGVPLLPGSALKGLARHHALRLGAEEAALAAGSEVARVLFGTQDDASYCTFFDAWYVPGSAPDDRPLAHDVVTVHHPQYYNRPAGKRRAPWDFDDPVPVGYLSARGSYLVAVSGPDADWSQFALALLERALSEDGAGGKTTSGYGRLAPVERPARAAEQGATGTAQAAPARAAHPLAGAIDALRADKIKPQIRGIFDQWRGLDDPADRVEVGQALLRKAESLGDARWLREKAAGWMSEIRTYLDEHGDGE